MQLNPPQNKAVHHKDGSLLILAGAGAGKTRVITERIITLIKGGVAPESILAITFTNKAAKEMRSRVLDRMKEESDLTNSETIPLVTTFHSLGVQIIKENASYFGLTRHFTIFDRDDSLRAVKRAMIKRDLDPKQYAPKKFLGRISNEKGNFVSSDQFKLRDGKNYFDDLVAEVWEEYERTLKKERACDFDDLLLKPALLLKNEAKVREYYQNRFKYVHVDEYQDTNNVQYTLTKLIAQAHGNICVVGDTDQNIYSWRGANLKNIFKFEEDFPKTTTVLLEENYRSTKRIIDAANEVIKKNEMRKEKNLFSNGAEGEKITLYIAYDGQDEARYVAHTAKEHIQEDVDMSSIAVLYRANYQSRLLEEAFLKAGVDYQLLGTRFFDRKEIKDVISFIRLALNPTSISDLERVINVPPRGIGKVTLMRIVTDKEDELSPKFKLKITDFREKLKKIATFAQENPTSDTIKFTIKETGIEDLLLTGSDDDKERLENIRELVSLAKKYDELNGTEGIEKLIEDAALATDQDSLDKTTAKAGVKLMTIHAAKGLEFNTVFITGLEQGLFPHERLNELGITKEAEEEERRLFYVALTRAEKKLYLTSANVRTIYGSLSVNVPSEFLSDIPEEHLEIINAGDNSDFEEPKEKTVYLEW